LAEAFRDAGWTVRFVTTGVSRLSFLKRDPRLDRLQRTDCNRWITAPDGVETYVYCPLVHPFARYVGINPITDHLFARLYRDGLRADLGRGVAASDLVVFESSAALLLFEEVGRLAPRARRVYRVSDDVRVVGMAPSILAAEDAAVGRFDLISVPSRVLLQERFTHLATARFHPHGLDLQRLEAARDAPQPELDRPACVALGTTLFNAELLALCAQARPDVRFYIVGALPAKCRIKLPNITWFGELPFEEALKMAAACDIAAAFYRAEEGTTYLAETSNKIAQYIFFQKPIVGPRHLAALLGRVSFFAVDPQTEAGAREAIDRALTDTTHPEAPPGLLRPWSVVRDEILQDVGLVKPVSAAPNDDA
jgi:2-beta-glucuronyltransferase